MRDAVVVVVGIACLAACSGDNDFPEPPRASAAPLSTPAPPLPFTAEDATELASDFSSGDPVRVRKAVAVPDEAVLTDESISAMADLGAIQFDVTTLVYGEDGTAEVGATVDGSSWTVYLVEDSGSWHIAATSQNS